jgi:hypothetical protein
MLDIFRWGFDQTKTCVRRLLQPCQAVLIQDCVIEARGRVRVHSRSDMGELLPDPLVLLAMGIILSRTARN